MKIKLPKLSLKPVLITVCIIIVLIIILYFATRKPTPKPNPATPPKDGGGGKGNGSGSGYDTNPHLTFNEAVINALPDGTDLNYLEQGQKSKMVFLLQYALNKINNDTLTLDGNFGPQTAASCIMQFGSNYVSIDDANALLQEVTQLGDINPTVVYIYQNLQ